jgi:hypothetical protein
MAATAPHYVKLAREYFEAGHSLARKAHG